MTKVTKIIEHDWLAVRVTFADGQQANVKWNWGGLDVVVKPSDPKRGELLSLIVKEAESKKNDAGYGFNTPGKIADKMEEVARRSNDLEAYVTGLKAALKVSAQPIVPKAAANAPSKTVSDLKKSRGWILKATFPTGERVELKINASSVGLAIDPNIPTKWNDITNFVFGVKQSGIMTDERLAQVLKEVADKAATIDEWIAGMRPAVFPGA